MSTAVEPARLTHMATQWRVARQLYAVYSAVGRQFDLGLPPSKDLEYPIDRSEPEAIERVHAWLAEADEKIQVWQLRQVLQSGKLATEQTLQRLIEHFLEKENKTGSDRDKADFLLAQFFFAGAPAAFHSREVDLDDVAQVLEPVLGEVSPHVPKWLEPLEGVIAGLRACESLADLLGRQLLDQARKLKIDAGEMFFGASALLAFTRFNFIVRGAFVRLIHADLHAIRLALHGLEQREQRVFDCTAAGLSASETAEQLRQFCHEWKTMFRAAYSSGQSFQQLIQLRQLLEATLAAPAPVIAAPAPAVETVPQPAPTAAPEPVPVVAPEPIPAAVKVPPMPPVIAKPAAKIPAAPSKSPQTTEIQPAQAPAALPKAPAAAAPQPVKAAAPAVAAPKTAAAPALAPAKAAAVTKPATAPAKAAPAARTKTVAPAAADPAPADVDRCLELIAGQLLKVKPANSVSVTSVTLGPHTLMLSSWEVAAFVAGGDDLSDALQRAVAARALLVRAAEDRKQGKPVDVKPVLAAAHAEAAQLQAQVAVAKEKKDIDAAVNLAATARRLLGLIGDLEQGPAPGK